MKTIKEEIKMGIYSNNSTYLSDNDIVANEAYATSTGALELMVECQKNDLALFNYGIGLDFQEAAAYASNDEYMMESVDYLNEASATGIWHSFIELVKKVAAKIKAIFEKFIAKLNSLFIRDTKELLKKYETKFDTNDISHMSVKHYRPIKEYDVDSVLELDTFRNIKLDNMQSRFSGKNDASEITKEIKKKEKFLSIAIKGQTESDTYTFERFSEDLERKMMDPETDADGAVDRQKDTIKEVLRNNHIITNIDKKKRACLKTLDGLKREAEKASKEADRAEYQADGEVSASTIKGRAVSRANAAVTELNNATAACTEAFSEYTRNLKKIISQCKKVFVMGATYVPHNNSSILLNAYGEVLEEEVMNYFDED